jgi:hypothetical protein
MEERYITLDWYCDYRPVLVNGGIAYIWGDSIVEWIDISSTDWINTYSVSVMWKVRAITLIWDTYYIYSNDWSNGYLSSWDWVSNNVSYTQKRTDDPIINVANMWNYDYVICWNNTKRLYLRSWWDKQLLYGSDNIEYDRQLLNFYPEKTNAIETVNNVVYIAGKNCIYTYWTLKACRYKSLSKIPITDCSEITSIFYVPNWNYIKVWYIDYAEENVKYARISTSISSWEYPNEWFVETLAYTWWDVSIEKQPNRIMMN